MQVIMLYVMLYVAAGQEDILLVEIDQPDDVQTMCCDATNFQTPCDEDDCQCDEDEAQEWGIYIHTHIYTYINIRDG